MKPVYAFGDEVRVVRAIRNDGTMPGYPRGALLVRRGSTGFIREWGVFLQDQIIYQVHFLAQDLVVGCREQELIAGEAPWAAGQFQYGDTIACTCPLSIQGEVVVSPGQHGRIEATGQGAEGESYTVAFGERWFQVPPSAIRLLEEAS